MAFEEDKRSDLDIWAEEYDHAEDKEYKKQLKQEAKEMKKAAKKAKKNASDDAEGTEDASSEVDSNEALEENVPSEYDVTADYKKEKKKKEKKSEDINIVKELFNLVIYIGIIIIICYCIITFVGQRTTVHGHSMENTLQDGDNLWIDKFTYHFSDPKRFDVVVFPYQGQDVYYIKRVIGLPGETVQITPEGNILIDGQVLQESYGREIILDSGTASEPRTLGPDEYFVLGDNRNDSRDSRWADVGDINKKDIIGKAVLRLSPFKKFGKVK